MSTIVQARYPIKNGGDFIFNNWVCYIKSTWNISVLCTVSLFETVYPILAFSVLSLYVCISVCLSACIHQKPHTKTLQNFLYTLLIGCGSVILRQQCNKLCTFVFVVFTRWGQWGKIKDNAVRSSSPCGSTSRPCHTHQGWSLLSLIILFNASNY